MRRRVRLPVPGQARPVSRRAGACKDLPDECPAGLLLWLCSRMVQRLQPLREIRNVRCTGSDQRCDEHQNPHGPAFAHPFAALGRQPGAQALLIPRRGLLIDLSHTTNRHTFLHLQSIRSKFVRSLRTRRILAPFRSKVKRRKDDPSFAWHRFAHCDASLSRIWLKLAQKAGYRRFLACLFCSRPISRCALLRKRLHVLLAAKGRTLCIVLPHPFRNERLYGLGDRPARQQVHEQTGFR